MVIGYVCVKYHFKEVAHRSHDSIPLGDKIELCAHIIIIVLGSTMNITVGS